MKIHHFLIFVPILLLQNSRGRLSNHLYFVGECKNELYIKFKVSKLINESVIKLSVNLQMIFGSRYDLRPV